MAGHSEPRNSVSTEAHATRSGGSRPRKIQARRIRTWSPEPTIVVALDEVGQEGQSSGRRLTRLEAALPVLVVLVAAALVILRPAI